MSDFLTAILVVYVLTWMHAWARGAIAGSAAARYYDDGGRAPRWLPGASSDDYARINPGTGLPCHGGSSLDSSGRCNGQGLDD